MLVIGDSVARSLGAGLEEWGSSNRAASVWDVSRDGCGLLLDGDIQGLYAGLGPLPPDCAVAAGRWSQQISDFRPDVVLVLSTIWDLADRKLPSWRSTQRPGDQQFDSYAIDTYGSFADMVTKADPSARIAWLNVPCVDATHGGLPFGTPKTRTAFEAGRRNHVNTVVLPAVALTRPAMRVVYFACESAPGGSSPNGSATSPTPARTGCTSPRPGPYGHRSSSPPAGSRRSGLRHTDAVPGPGKLEPVLESRTVDFEDSPELATFRAEARDFLTADAQPKRGDEREPAPERRVH